jgi:hypothetical protein
MVKFAMASAEAEKPKLQFIMKMMRGNEKVVNER